jgi:hypothetical protein
MAEVGTQSEEDCFELDKYVLRTINDLKPEELASLKQRIEDLTLRGVIKPNAFDPLDRNRKLRWPQPVPRDSPTT